MQIKNIASKVVGDDYIFSFRGVEVIRINLSLVPENYLLYLDLLAGEVFSDGHFLLELSKKTTIELQNICCCLRQYPLVSRLNGQTEVYYYE